MGLETKTKGQFLTVSFGCIRKKCDSNVEGAIERTIESTGQKVYALEYRALSGILNGIYYKEHEKYGNSWVAVMEDGDNTWHLQIKEGNNFCIDFLAKLPYLKQHSKVRFQPYDYTSKNDGKRKRGLSIKTKEEGADEYVDVENYYVKFDENNNPKFQYEDYPQFDGDKTDKEDWRAYFIKLNKYLRKNAMAYLEKYFEKYSPDAGDSDDDYSEEENFEQKEEPTPKKDDTKLSEESTKAKRPSFL